MDLPIFQFNICPSLRLLVGLCREVVADELAYGRVLLIPVEDVYLVASDLISRIVLAGIEGKPAGSHVPVCNFVLDSTEQQTVNRQ